VFSRALLYQVGGADPSTWTYTIPEDLKGLWKDIMEHMPSYLKYMTQNPLTYGFTHARKL
jgi:hypothetical protein